MSKNKKIAVCIFAIAFSFGLNITGISPILGVLNEKYAGYGTSMVQLLQTLPYLSLMAGSLLVGELTTRFTRKKIAMAGLLIIGLCGVFPLFSESFAVLFAARLLIGFGFGILGPMTSAIITDFFPPEQRAGYLGLHIVGMGIGTMVSNLAGGALASLQYRYFFLVYAVAFVSLAVIRLILIETPVTAHRKASDLKLNGMVYVISFASLVHTLFINAYSTNIGIYVQENITTNTTVTGLVTAVNAAFALLVGMFFAKIAGLLKNFTMPFSLFAAAAGYGILLVLPGMAGVYVTSALCGVSQSCFMAIASYLITISVEPEAVAKASGIFSVIGGIGGLAAPLILGNTSAALLGENTANHQFIIAFAGMLIFGIIVTFITSRTPENNSTGQ
ncbi:MAG: MFS transporter [Clostridiales bacterium]|nr:MFS transporter [Clostridiales bacterium]